MATEGHAPLYCALRRGAELRCWRGPYVDENLTPEIDDAIDINVDAHLCVVRRSY